MKRFGMMGLSALCLVFALSGAVMLTGCGDEKTEVENAASNASAEAEKLAKEAEAKAEEAKKELEGAMGDHSQ